MRHPLPAREDWIRLPVAGSKSGLYTTVTESGEGRISVAVPTDGVEEHYLDEGARVVVEWTTARGVMRATGFVGCPLDINVPTLLLELTDPEVIQRRHDVRADVAVSFLLTCAGAPLVRGTTVDLSGGGMLAAVPVTMDLGQVADIRLELQDLETISTMGRVLRVDGDGRFGLMFEKLEPLDRERLIKFVFAAHRANYIPQNRRF